MGAMPEMRGRGDIKARGTAVTRHLSPVDGGRLVPDPVHRGARARAAGAEDEGRDRPAGRGDRRDDAGQAPRNAIVVPPARQQLIGVTFGTVERRPLATTLRAAGRVEMDERNLAEVTLKYEAFVQKLFVAETGKSVRRGQPLAVLYSPDLLSAEEELLAARRSGAADAAGRRPRAPAGVLGPFARAAAGDREERPRRRPADHRRARRAAWSSRRTSSRGPASSPAPRSTGSATWGASGCRRPSPSATPASSPSASRRACACPPCPSRWTRGSPSSRRWSNDKTRTIEARLEIQNPRLALKPGMFADVQIDAALGPRLAVPDAALLMSGEHRYAFVDRGGGAPASRRGRDRRADRRLGRGAQRPDGRAIASPPARRSCCPARPSCATPCRAGVAGDRARSSPGRRATG